MRLGKLDNNELYELILSKFKSTRAEVMLTPKIGMDCAVVDLGSRIAVLSTDPITAAKENLGRLTVCVSCNDAAAAGAEPIGLLITLLAPPQTEKKDISDVADDIARTAQELNVDIIGGHTEVTDAVTRMITCATVLAKTERGSLITPDGMREGDAIVLTKTAGLEGTSVIASDFPQLLKGLSQAELNEAISFKHSISVLKEGLYAAKHGATAMHDVTEGGVLGAAWELSQASGCGMMLEKVAIPVHPVTAKICGMLGIDPLRLVSSGCMLIACKDGDALVEGLSGIGVPAKVIGRAGGSGVRFSGGESIGPPEADELYKVLG